jgi:lipoate-protein ligase A
MLKIDHVKKEYEYLTSWEWLYQYSPDFSNNIEKKFPWGLVDIYMTVEAGNTYLSTILSRHHQERPGV